MKKILSILLIALMLVSAVSITAFADNELTFITCRNSVDFELLKDYDRVEYYFDWYNYKDGEVFSSGNRVLVLYNNTANEIQIRFVTFENTNVLVTYTADGNYIKPSAASQILYKIGFDASTVDPMALQFIGLFFDIEGPDVPDVPEVTECDGTSCPIKDINLDEICDTCGNAVTMSMRASSAVEGTHFVVNGIAFPLEYRTSSLEGSLKDIMQRRYDEDVNWYAFITVSDTGVYHLRITNAPFVASRNTGMLYIPDSVTETEWTSMQYRLSGDYWAYNGDFTIEKGDSFPLSTVYATSNTLFFDDLTVYMQGENFFQLTPKPIDPAEIPGIQEAGARIIQVMKIVSIVAVSCLALWISLVVLLRVLRTYLKK